MRDRAAPVLRQGSRRPAGLAVAEADVQALDEEVILKDLGPEDRLALESEASFVIASRLIEMRLTRPATR